MAGLRVKQNDIRVESGNVVINSPQMINELIHNSGDVIQLLSTNGPQVKLSDISIDEVGRIVIDNPEFKKAVEDALSKISALSAGASNGICGLRC